MEPFESFLKPFDIFISVRFVPETEPYDEDLTQNKNLLRKKVLNNLMTETVQEVGAIGLARSISGTGSDFLNSFRHQIILYFLKAVNVFLKSFLFHSF